MKPGAPYADPDGGFEEMLGTSSPMLGLFRALRKVAASDASVLLLGETGTGKELAARAIHARSASHAGPFVVVNCSAIPATLAESELFGYEKGAFTGAHELRKGLIEYGAGGTLFLDEIGELTPSAQSKLLRFLQEHTVQRVGGRNSIHVNTRVIAATHVDLKGALSEKRFREDLYYRLAVVVIRLPALREREQDIHRLAEEFLRREALKAGKPGLTFSGAARRSLDAHTWPGNVRELQNRVQRAVIMAEGDCVTPADLELDDVLSGLAGCTLKAARENLERELVQRALRRHVGKIAPAAAELAVSRPTFYDLMQRLGISREGRD